MCWTVFQQKRILLAAFTGVAVVAAALLFVRPAGCDVVVFKNGDTFRGEVLEDRAGTLVLRYRNDDPRKNGEWTTESFDRDSIRAVYDEPGDQSDGEGPRKDPRPRKDPNDKADAERLEEIAVAVVPLHGRVGGIAEDSASGGSGASGGGGTSGGGFDAALVEAAFAEAVRRGAGTVILDIDSPGGLVDEMEAICEAILDWRGELRIVAWPDEAMSAAAIITMCCPEIVVRPGSLVGAATIVRERESGDGVEAVDAKAASPHYARQRRYMERSGQPYAVVAAMTIQDVRLWWSPTAGFTTDEPPSGSDHRLVDGGSTILTMTAADAIAWKIAEGEADDVAGVLAALEIDADAGVADLSEFVERRRRAARRALDDVKAQFDAYIQGLAGLNQTMIALFEAKKDGREDEADELQRAFIRTLRTVRTAGRRILRIDRAATEGLEIPGEFVERIAEDEPLLVAVARLLSQDRPEAWNEAGRTLGAVLRGWKDLTGF